MPRATYYLAVLCGRIEASLAGWLMNGGSEGGRESTILFAEIIQITASIALRIVGVFNYNSLSGSGSVEEERVTFTTSAALPYPNNQRAEAATTWMMSGGLGAFAGRII